MPFMNINSELITMTRRCDHFREPFRFRYLDFCNTSAGRFVLKDFEACISYFPPWLQCVQRVISHSVRYTMRVISCYTSFGCVEWAVSWPHAAFGPPRYLSQLSLRWVYRIYYGVFCPRLPARCVLSPMSVKGKPQVIEIGQGFRRGTWRRRRDVVTLEWVGSSVVLYPSFLIDSTAEVKQKSAGGELHGSFVEIMTRFERVSEIYRTHLVGSGRSKMRTLYDESRVLVTIRGFWRLAKLTVVTPCSWWLHCIHFCHSK